MSVILRTVSFVSPGLIQRKVAGRDRNFTGSSDGLVFLADYRMPSDRRCVAMHLFENIPLDF